MLPLAHTILIRTLKISAINVMMEKCKLSGDPSGIANAAQRGNKMGVELLGNGFICMEQKRNDDQT
jgi:hypothetical protein